MSGHPWAEGVARGGTYAVKYKGAWYHRVPDEDGYWVTKDGRVFSTKRGPPKEMAVSDVKGYPSTSIMRDGKKVGTRVYVHLLVCRTFHGPRPFPEAQVRHRDGNPQNCREDNVMWGTRKENSEDKLLHGTEVSGSRNGMSRLTDEDREAIKERAVNGEPFTAIAAAYGMNADYMAILCRRLAPDLPPRGTK